MRRARFAIPVALILLASGGCAWLRGPEAQINFAADRYASADILYRLESRSANATTQKSNYSLTGASPSAGGVIQSLAIKYPHPTGRRGYARVELVLEKPAASDEQNPEPKSGWFSDLARMARENMPGIAFEGNVIAAWGLDIPVNEIDPIVAKLQSQGFFTTANCSLREVQLGARINGAGSEKTWSRVTELDALAIRVHKEGSFVSHKGLTTQSFSQTASLPSAGSPGAPQAGTPAQPTFLPVAQPASSLAMRPTISPTAPPARPPSWTPPNAPAGALAVEPLPKVEPIR